MLDATWSVQLYTSLPIEMQSVHQNENLCHDTHDAIWAYRFPWNPPNAAPPTVMPATTSPVSVYHSFRTCCKQFVKGQRSNVKESDMMSPVAATSRGARVGRIRTYIGTPRDARSLHDLIKHATIRVYTLPIRDNAGRSGFYKKNTYKKP